jgi:Zn-dependent protease
MEDRTQDWLTSLSGGDDAAPAKEQIEVEKPLNSFETSVLGELEKMRNPKGNWAQTLTILVVSLALFVALGKGNNPILFTAMLVGVLFIHELGHYAGMRIFGYRNVRMFFIPLFGAAVSGQKTTAKTYQEAIVTLLGPLPGLCIAVVLVGVAFVPTLTRDQRLCVIQAAMLLGLINGFNLLPVFPLDGGRLLNQILFSRNRYLECVFQVLAAIAMTLYGAVHQNYFFCFLGIWLLMTVAPTFKTNTIARLIGGQLAGPLPPLYEPIPTPIFRTILALVQHSMPGVKTAKGAAGVVFRVWEKMHAEPPDALITVALLLVYLLAGLLAVPWVLLIFFHAAKK